MEGSSFFINRSTCQQQFNQTEKIFNLETVDIETADAETINKVVNLFIYHCKNEFHSLNRDIFLDITNKIKTLQTIKKLDGFQHLLIADELNTHFKNTIYKEDDDAPLLSILIKAWELFKEESGISIHWNKNDSNSIFTILPESYDNPKLETYLSHIKEFFQNKNSEIRYFSDLSEISYEFLTKYGHYITFLKLTNKDDDKEYCLSDEQELSKFLQKCPNLHSLNIQLNTTTLPSLKNFYSLEILQINSSSIIEELLELPDSLLKLGIHSEIKKLGELPANLKTLLIKNLNEINAFPQNLKELNLIDPKFKTIPSFPLNLNALWITDLNSECRYQLPKFPPNLIYLNLDLSILVLLPPAFPENLESLEINSMPLGQLPFLPLNLKKLLISNLTERETKEIITLFYTCMKLEVHAFKIFLNQLKKLGRSDDLIEEIAKTISEIDLSAILDTLAITLPNHLFFPFALRLFNLNPILFNKKCEFNDSLNNLEIQNPNKIQLNKPLFIEYFAKVLKVIDIEFEEVYQDSTHLLKVMFLEFSRNQENFQNIIEFLEVLYPEKTINIFYSSYKNPALDLLNKIGKNITYLRLYLTKTDFKENNLEEWFELVSNYCPKMKKLSLTLDDAKDLNLTIFKNLNNLHLTANTVDNFSLPDQLKNFTLNAKKQVQINAHFPELLELTLTTPDLKKVPPLPESLKKLRIFRGFKLEEFPLLPAGLTSLTIRGCENSLGKWPQMPANLEFLSIQDCPQLSLTHKWALLGLEKEPTLKRAILILTGFDSHESKVEASFLAKKYPLETLIENLDLICEKFQNLALIPFLFKIFDESPNVFFEYLDKMDLNPESLKRLKSNPLLNEILSSKLSGSKLFQFWNEPAALEEVESSKYQAIDLFKTLPQLFSKINFHNPAAVGYINPLTLMNDGIPTDLTELKQYLEKLLNAIKMRSSYVGVPLDETDRNNFYEKLENNLKQFVFHALIHFENKNDPNDLELLTASKELIKIALSGDHCGVRWDRDAREGCRAIKGNWSFNHSNESIDSLIANWFEDHSRGALETLMFHFSHLIEDAMQPHFFNQFGILLEKNLNTPLRQGIFDPDDKLTDLLESEEIIESQAVINLALNPLKLTQMIWLRLTDFIQNEMKKNKENYNEFQTGLSNRSEKEESSLNSGDLLELMRGVAEEICLPEIEKLEKQLNKRAFLQGIKNLSSQLEKARQRASYLSKKIESYKEPLEKIDLNGQAVNLKRKKGADEVEELPPQKRLKKEAPEEMELIEVADEKPVKSPLLEMKPFKKLKASEEEKSIKIKIKIKAAAAIEKLEKLETEIQSIEEQLKNSSSHQDKLKALGMQSAKNAFLNEKQRLLDNYLEKSGFFSIDEETFEMKLSAIGTFRALSYLKFFETHKDK